MIEIQFTEGKLEKAMKAVSKIVEHADCLHELFKDLKEGSEFGERRPYKHYDDDDDVYGSRYGMRRGGRY